MSALETADLIAGATTLLGSAAIVAIGAIIINKRPETNSLYVEDRMGFAVAKVATGIIVTVVGIVSFSLALSKVLQHIGT